MAKRKDDNVLQGPFELAHILPWGLNLALAVTAYGALHSYAIASASTQAAPGQIGDMATGEWFRTLASVGQYLVPLGLLAGPPPPTSSSASASSRRAAQPSANRATPCAN